MVSLVVNGQTRAIDADSSMPLLWALRDLLDLTGAKYGCGQGECGTCTVHLDGTPVRACVTPLSAAQGREVTTIEGLSGDGSHPLQRAWVEERAPQCGYCQPGQIMAAAALLEQHPEPTDAEIDQAMAGVICRCGTYPRIKKAIRRAAELAKEAS